MSALKAGHIFARRYRVEGELGSGGFATVYAARDGERPVALKIIEPDDDGGYTQEQVTRFERETAILAQLKSPYSVRLLDHGRAEGSLYLVFERLPGQDLRIRMGRSALPPGYVRTVLRQLCLALNELHRAGAIHRDLKPDNVRIISEESDRPICKLIDFGISRATEGGPSATRTGELIGTPRYMSPEQIRAKPLTPASDVYSLGLMGLEMLYGPDALASNDLLAQMPRVTAGFSAEIESSPDPELARALLSMTQVDPANRPQSVVPLLRLLGGETKQSVAEGREPRLARTGVVLGALLLLTAVAWFVTRPKPVTPIGRVSVPAALLANDNNHDTPPQRSTAKQQEQQPQQGCAHGETPWPLVVVFSSDFISPESIIDAGNFREWNNREIAILTLIDKEHGTWRFGLPGEQWRKSEAVSGARGKIQRFIGERCIDRNRVFLVGHADGARAALPLLCEEWVTAAAFHSFPLDTVDPLKNITEAEYELCSVPKPAIWMVPKDSKYFSYGPDDRNCSNSLKMPPEETRKMWLEANQCEGEPVRKQYEKGYCEEYSCVQPFEYCPFKGNRGFPDVPELRFAGTCKAEISTSRFPASAIIWDFFQRVTDGTEEAEEAEETGDE